MVTWGDREPEIATRLRRQGNREENGGGWSTGLVLKELSELQLWGG